MANFGMVQTSRPEGPHLLRRPALIAIILVALAIPLYFTLSTKERAPAPTSPPPQTAPAKPGTIPVSDWLPFKARFIEPNGKLVDSFSRLSHSEGQGYALLLALAAGDHLTFDRVWDWTRTNLKREDDALLAWKWKSDQSGGGTVADSNDATDADLLVAWALHRAAKQWQEPAYDKAATAIATAILEKLVRDVGGYAILLPGRSGFEKVDGITINLSYWVFPAFRSLNEIVPSPRWFQLEQSGLSLLKQARFGVAKLPADWMVLRAPQSGGITLSFIKEQPLYGFDAVRIPLYLLWDGKADTDTLAPFLAFWRATPTDKIPATVNLFSGEPAPYAASPGVRAIVIAATNHAETAFCKENCAVPTLPSIEQDRDYYSAALGLLSRLALSETP